ncbi:MAG: InlB B-repeat-containing protein [Fibrobacterales bacterium]
MFLKKLLTLLILTSFVMMSCIFDDNEKPKGESSADSVALSVNYIVDAVAMGVTADSIIIEIQNGQVTDTVVQLNAPAVIDLSQRLNDTFAVEYKLFSQNNYIGMQKESFVVDTANAVLLDNQYRFTAKPVNKVPIVSLSSDSARVMVGDSLILTTTWTDDDAAVTFSSVCSDNSTVVTGHSKGMKCVYSTPGTFVGKYTVTDAYHTITDSIVVVVFPDPTKRVFFNGSLSAHVTDAAEVEMILTGDNLIAPVLISAVVDYESGTYAGHYDLRQPGMNYTVDVNIKDSRERVTGVAHQVFTIAQLNIAIAPIDAWNAKPWLTIEPVPAASINDLISVTYASGDSLNGGLITMTEWKYGDNEYIETITPTLSLQLPSVAVIEYPVSIRVTDNDGNIVESVVNVEVLQDKPVVSLVYEDTLNVGVDSLYFSWVGTDGFGEIEEYAFKEVADTAWLVLETSTKVDWVNSGTDGVYSYILRATDDDGNVVYDTTTVENFTVDFNLSGGVGTINSQIIKSKGALFESAIHPSKQGYHFGGWCKEVELTNSWSYTADRITQDTTLFAQWSAQINTVSFEANSGAGTMPAVEIATVATAQLPAVTFEKEGYQFIGWSTTVDGAVSIENQAQYTMGVSSVTLYAQWSANNNVLSFAGNGSETGNMDDVSMDTDEKGTLPVNQYVRSGYAFQGWALTDSDVVVYDDNSEFTMGAGAQALYAVWSALDNSVLFNANGGSGNMAVQVAATNVTIELTENSFIKPGYSFAGWALTENGAVVYGEQAEYVMAAEGVELFAQWAANTNSITFMANGASRGTMALHYATTDAAVTLPENAFERIGYTFKGWSTTAGGAIAYVDQESFTMGGDDVVLYAEWERIYFTIAFATSQNGSVSGLTSVEYGGAITLENFPEAGFNFVRYDVNGTADLDRDVLSNITSDITITGQFSQRVYEITYRNTYGGTIDGDDRVAHGGSVSLTHSSITGHHFEEFIVESGSADINGNALINVTSDIVISGHFEINTYTVSYVSNSGGSVTGNTTITHGSTVPVTAITNEGYDFIALSVVGNATVLGNQVQNITSNITVEGVFDLKKYQVRFESTVGGVVEGSSANVDHGGSVQLTTSANAGYDFVRFDIIQGTGTVQGHSVTEVRSNITIKGVFSRKSYVIEYQTSNGGTISGNTEVLHGRTVDLSKNPETGYDFTGYEILSGDAELIGDDLTNVTSTIVIRGTFTLKQYRIRYPYTNNGSVSGGETVSHGGSVTIEPSPDVGYQFDAYDVTGNADVIGNELVNVYSDVTVRGTFSRKSYTIEYQSSVYGSITGPVSADHGGSITLNNTPSTGYDFIRYEIVSGNADVDGSLLKNIAGDVVVRGIFEIKSYTITIIPDGFGAVIVDNNTVSHGGSATLSNTPVTGYEFVKYIQTGDADLNGNDLVNITSDLTIRGKFSSLQFTITYETSQGGTIFGDATVYYGGEITVSNTPDEGYQYHDFTVVSGDARKVGSQIREITTDITLRGSFSLKTYNVSIIGNPNGVVTVDPETVNHGGSATLSNIPEAGFTFIQYTLRSGDAVLIGNRLTNITSPLVIESEFSQNTYNVSYATTTGGSVTGPKVASHGGSINLTFSADQGYQLADWTVSGPGTKVGQTVQNIRGNITITPTFEKKTYSIAYTSVAGGEIHGPISVLHGENISITKHPLISHVFSDVTIEGTFGSSDVNGVYNVQSNLTVRGEFTFKTLNFTYNATAGGDLTGVPTATYGSDILLSPVPTSGYQFDGYTVNPSDAGVINGHTLEDVKSNAQITANFSLKQYKITITTTGSGSTSRIGDVNVTHGGSLPVTFSPAHGNVARTVKVDGATVTNFTGYTFSNVTSARTLEVGFAVNAAPTISSMIGSKFVPINESVSLTAAAADANGDAVTYSWDVDGNGTTDRTGANASFTYTSPLSSDIELTVCDRFGACNDQSVELRAYRWVRTATSLPILHATNHGMSGGVHDGKLIITIGGYPNQGIYTSQDGVSWTHFGGSHNLGGGYDIKIVNSGTETILLDGSSGDYVLNGTSIALEYRSYTTSYNGFGVVAYGNKACHLMGSTRGYSNNNVTCRYSDGTWIQHSGTNLPAEDDVHGYYYNGKSWVITSVGSVYTTSHISSYSNWTNLHNHGWTSYSRMAGTVFDNKMWLSGGDGWGSTAPKTDNVKFSTDGINWSDLSVGLPTGAMSTHRMVSYDNKMWIVGGAKDGIGNYNQEIWYMDIGQ